MNLPNKLTIFRIILVPIMVIIPYLGLQGEVFGIPITMLIIDAIFIIASITDKLDGTLARKSNNYFWKIFRPYSGQDISTCGYDNAC
jgi:CDP-diacylglycerol--glycerol-3-phosphate 3-phosphatidyltransferase